MRLEDLNTEPTPPLLPAVAQERCENCGGVIGRLETPCVWNGSVVCGACHSKLSKSDVTVVDSNPRIVVVREPAHPAPAVQFPVITTQRTGKFWKLNILLASLLLIGGGVTAIVGFTGGAGRDVGPIGLLAFSAGFAWYVCARFGAWWFHG